MTRAGLPVVTSADGLPNPAGCAGPGDAAAWPRPASRAGCPPRRCGRRPAPARACCRALRQYAPRASSTAVRRTGPPAAPASAAAAGGAGAGRVGRVRSCRASPAPARRTLPEVARLRLPEGLPSRTPTTPSSGAVNSSQRGPAATFVPLAETTPAEARPCASMPMAAPHSTRRPHACLGNPARSTAHVPASARQNPPATAQTRSGSQCLGAATTSSASSRPAHRASVRIRACCSTCSSLR